MFVQSAAANRRFAFGAGCVIMAAKKTKGRPEPRERKHMSNFNDLYDHVAADRSRAMQLLGIQDIRRKAVAELLAAGAYTEPDNIEDMTDAEREQHKAEAAYALGRPHILETAKMPVQDGDETYAIAVTATSETPNCIALCVQTKLEELYASGIVDRSANHRPRLFVVAANDRPDEDVQGLRTALDMLRVAYPDFHIEPRSCATRSTRARSTPRRRTSSAWPRP